MVAKPAALSPDPVAPRRPSLRGGTPRRVEAAGLPGGVVAVAMPTSDSHRAAPVVGPRCHGSYTSRLPSCEDASRVIPPSAPIADASASGSQTGVRFSGQATTGTLYIYAGEPAHLAGPVARTPCRTWQLGAVERVSHGGLLLERLCDEGAYADRGGR